MSRYYAALVTPVTASPPQLARRYKLNILESPTTAGLCLRQAAAWKKAQIF